VEELLALSFQVAMEGETKTEEVNVRKRQHSTNSSEGGNQVSNGSTAATAENLLNPTPIVFEDFQSFKLKEVLRNSAENKCVFVEAVHKDGGQAVIVLEKKPFTQEVLDNFFSEKSKLKQLFQNDIYGSYDCIPIAEACGKL
jgi:hypothetical protein